MSKVIYLEKTDIYSTLTTYIYCHFAMMFAAEQQGKDAFIHWPKNRFLKSYEDHDKFAQMPNAYDWYFKQPKVQQAEKTTTWVWENWKDPTPTPFMAQPLQVIKDYYKKHLHFSDEVEQRGLSLMFKYKIDFANTIGITWRGTDIYLDGRPRIPIETYFPFIDEVLKPGMRIMCTAEEETILDPLLARYPQAFTIDEFISSPFQGKQNPERFSQMSGFQRGLQPALMVWLFSKCAHYIKNRSSTGAVSSWLSEGRIVNIFHGENLGFPANVDYIEIEGKKYSADNKLIQ